MLCCLCEFVFVAIAVVDYNNKWYPFVSFFTSHEYFMHSTIIHEAPPLPNSRRSRRSVRHTHKHSLALTQCSLQYYLENYCYDYCYGFGICGYIYLHQSSSSFWGNMMVWWYECPPAPHVYSYRLMHRRTQKRQPTIKSIVGHTKYN